MHFVHAVQRDLADYCLCRGERCASANVTTTTIQTTQSPYLRSSRGGGTTGTGAILSNDAS